MISRFFIDRPVLANVLAILMVLLGGVALFGLPVAQYPNVVPPTVGVTTSYPGASARIIADTVALPIEQQVNGVDHMLYMQSNSTSDGTYSLTVTFAIGTDPDAAQVLVQNRVSAALSSLPSSVQSQGVNVRKKSTATLQIITLTSSNPAYDSLYLSNYATINLRDELSRLPGVGDVTVYGAGQYAMRVWLDPERMRARGLNTADVVQALQAQNQQVTVGQIGTPPAPAGTNFQYTLNIAGRLTDPSQFENIIVKTGTVAGTNQITRVRDIGRVDLGAQTYNQSFASNGAEAAGIGIALLPGANALSVAAQVDAKMKVLAQQFPQGLSYSIPFDTTTFVNESINEVYTTLIEAGVLVLVVILVFLQDWRAMLVPATTVPVTIIGAFACMAALGFTVNLSTLFAIVLAIGIVVDDAIVVVEGAAKYIEAGMSSHDAAVKAMDELLGPIIGITLVLMSVFIPAAFLPGLTGRMFAQFALVIAATALLSAINAATLKPTQCALWLRPAVPPEKRNFFYRGFNAVYGGVERRYTALVRRMVRHALPIAVIGLVMMGAAGYYLTRIPTAFLPVEDQGYLLIGLQLPDGASIERTRKALDQASTIARATPGVAQTITIAGISPLDNNASMSNAGVVYVILKDYAARGPGGSLREIYTRLNRGLDAMQEAQSIVILPPAIQGIGNSGGFTLMVELRDGSFDLPKLEAVTRTLIADGANQSALSRMRSSFRANVPQYDLQIDRVKAESLQVSVGQVFQTLSTYLGSSYIGQINKFGRTFQVYAQADPKSRVTPAAIEALPLITPSGVVVPLGTIATLHRTVGPSLVTLYNLYPAASITGTPGEGFSSGQALSVMDDMSARVLPPRMATEWTAMSYQERAVGNQLTYAFGLAIVLVYLVLAAQYGSWLAPISIVLGVPLALIGPVLVLTLLGIANNLYTQIGLMLLIALSAKNAILIVEVAREERNKHGREILESAIEAARSRLRPILMTSFAFILGVLPLVVATGAGANARRSIGITVFSGMLASTCLAVLFVPIFFVVVQRFEERGARRKAKVLASVQ
jgi:hydrophobic/amphiphilic exporter-1 (mainly G- bacteria), HAE1 family